MGKQLSYVDAAISIVNKGFDQTKIPVAFWIECHDSGIDVDGSINYCRNCVQEKVKNLRTEHPKSNFYVRQCRDGNESDVKCVCDGCDSTIEYSLTEHGVRSELDHFSETKLNLKSEVE